MDKQIVSLVPAFFQVIILSLFLSCPAGAIETSSEIDRLITKNNWKEAARLIFSEARQTNKHESSISIGQAKAGFIEDALITIEGTHLSSHPWLLLSVVKQAPSLSSVKREQILSKALDAARDRTTGKFSDYIKSGDFARIALYYSSHGTENEAKSVFSEAIESAMIGLKEDNNGGFRQITGRMRKTSSEDIKPWMISALQSKLIKEEGDPQSRAFACIDMIAIVGRMEKSNLAVPFIECATIAISNIEKARMKKLASKALVKEKEEISHSNSPLSNWPFVESLHEARSGNAQKSYAIVSSLGQNLYVDHKSTAYDQVFNDAIKRGDLKTALYFAERPVRKMPHHEISVWYKLAEKQTELGDQYSATESYRKASSYLDRIIASRRGHLFDIQSVLRLGESMFRAGMKDEGHHSILLAKSLIDRIPEKRVDDRINASISVSESLWRTRMQTEAKKLIQQSYFYAHSYDKNSRYGKRKKARFLSAIGESISMFSEIKPTNKPTTKMDDI